MKLIKNSINVFILFKKAIIFMERPNLDVYTVVNQNGVYTMTLDSVSYELITHAMSRYQKQLDTSNKWAEKKRGDGPKKTHFKGRPRIVFHLTEIHRSPQNIIQPPSDIKDDSIK